MNQTTVNGIKAVLALIFGFLVLRSPGNAIVALATYFGIFAALAGVIALIFAFRSMKKKNNTGFWFFEGSVNILIGIIVIAYPELTAGIFIILFGILALIISFLQLAAYNRFQKMGLRAGLVLFNAIVSLIVGLLLLFNPFEGAKAVVMLIGVYAVFYGIFALIQILLSSREY